MRRLTRKSTLRGRRHSIRKDPQQQPGKTIRARCRALTSPRALSLWNGPRPTLHRHGNPHAMTTPLRARCPDDASTLARKPVLSSAASCEARLLSAVMTCQVNFPEGRQQHLSQPGRRAPRPKEQPPSYCRRTTAIRRRRRPSTAPPRHIPSATVRRINRIRNRPSRNRRRPLAARPSPPI